MVVVTKEVRSSSSDPSVGIAASISPVTAEQLRELFVFRPSLVRREIEERLALGHLCFAAWHQNRIVHAGWGGTARAHIPFIHSDILLAPDEFYIYDSFTLPQFRRMNLVLARSAAMHKHFGALGYKRSYGVVALMNAGGLAVLEPAGYRIIGMYGCVRLGPLHRTWAYPGSTEALPPLQPHVPA